MRDLLVSGIEVEGKSDFDVVIAYEDYATGAHAKQTYDHLLHTFGGHCRMGHTMWCFDALRIGELRQSAAEEAAQANLILIAVWNRSDLPATVKFWIEQWLEHKTARLGALAALIENDPAGSAGSTSAMCSYLRQVCWRGHLDFFSTTTDNSQFDPWLHAAPVPPCRTDSGKVEIWDDAEFDPQWGIND